MLKTFNLLWTRPKFYQQILSSFPSRSILNVSIFVSLGVPSLFHTSLRCPLTESKTIPKFASQFAAVRSLTEKHRDKHVDQAFYLGDVGTVKKQYKQWVQKLPRVVPFYAVKCNPDPVLVSTLFQQGAKFDVASSGEISLCLSLGIPPESILFANPVKNIKHIEYAASSNVKRMTFDNEYELDKIKRHHPRAELILRLLPDDSGSLMSFGSKFGCRFSNVHNLLLKAKRLNLKVVGTAFHVGSGCYDPAAYDKAIKLSKAVHDLAITLQLPRFTVIDIGGGLSGTNAESVMDGKIIPSFDKFAVAINDALDKYFPQGNNSVRMDDDVEICAEIGRYFGTQFQTLFTTVSGKRKEVETIADESKQKEYKVMYYINNSTYDAFNCVYNDHYTPQPLLLNELLQKLQTTKTEGKANRMSKQVNCTIVGESCDSRDSIVKNITLPELDIGDIIAWENMGAYTSAAGCSFNGFKRAAIYYYEV